MNFLLILIFMFSVKSSIGLIDKTNIPETSYLFSYFDWQSQSEGLRIAYSTDGYTFEPLNNDEVLLKPEIGDKILRDPCILYGPDKKFHLVWTTGWEGKEIGYAWSNDLKNWSEQVLIPVMGHEMGAENAWAPELIYDTVNKHYLIFWSSTITGKFPETANSNDGKNNNRVYSTTTTDFKTFTATKLYFNKQFNSIDATLLEDRENNEWLMFVKNNNAGEKNILLSKSDTPYGPWSEVSKPINGDYYAEGPTAVKIDEYYYVYFDRYELRANRIGAVRSNDLVNWEDISAHISFPVNASHGTVFEVSKSIVTMLADSGL